MGKTRLIAVIVVIVVILFSIVIGLSVRKSLFGPGLYHCINESDCMVVLGDVCGKAAAVNRAYITEWQAKIEAERTKSVGIVECKPAVPLAEFKAVCLREICYAEQKRPE
jgi:hypothetical protein